MIKQTKTHPFNLSRGVKTFLPRIMEKGNKAVNFYLVFKSFYQILLKVNKRYSWLRGGDLPQASSWLGSKSRTFLHTWSGWCRFVRTWRSSSGRWRLVLLAQHLLSLLWWRRQHRNMILGCWVDDLQIFPYCIGDEIRDFLIIFHWLGWWSMNLPILPRWFGRGVIVLIISTGFCP